MRVEIEQAWHQRLTRCIDDACARGYLCPIGDGYDSIVTNDHRFDTRGSSRSVDDPSAGDCRCCLRLGDQRRTEDEHRNDAKGAWKHEYLFSSMQRYFVNV